MSPGVSDILSTVIDRRSTAVFFQVPVQDLYLELTLGGGYAANSLFKYPISETKSALLPAFSNAEVVATAC